MWWRLVGRRKRRRLCNIPEAQHCGSWPELVHPPEKEHACMQGVLAASVPVLHSRCAHIGDMMHEWTEGTQQVRLVSASNNN